MLVPYDFEAFLRGIENLTYDQMIREANEHCRRAEAASTGRGGPQQRAIGSIEYQTKIKQFLFFLQSGARPGGASASDFASYRPAIEALVKKGHYKPEILNLF